MSTVHLVYPTNPGVIAAPWCIGNYLTIGLEMAGYTVQHYHWDDKLSDNKIKSSDIILGHPHPDPETSFRQLCASNPHNIKISIAPWDGSQDNVQLFNSLKTDWFCAICGEYWHDSVRAVTDRVTTLDLAVNRAHFPRVKHRFMPKGERKFLYIGCAHPKKNPHFLSSIAQSGAQLSHLGFGDIPLLPKVGEGVHMLSPRGLEIVKGHDFLLMGSINDANPTTVLEAMSWGLIPVITPQCGYKGVQRVEIDPYDFNATLLGLEYCQAMDEDVLLNTQRMNFDILSKKYTWKIFIDKVLEVIDNLK